EVAVATGFHRGVCQHVSAAQFALDLPVKRCDFVCFLWKYHTAAGSFCELFNSQSGGAEEAHPTRQFERGVVGGELLVGIDRNEIEWNLTVLDPLECFLELCIGGRPNSGIRPPLSLA